MADDKQQRIETLQDRVDELEATVSKMLPSRRDALKLGAAGAVGAVGMAGSASAQNSGQTGTIGTDSDRVDVNAEDIDAVSVNTAALSTDVTAGEVVSRSYDQSYQNTEGNNILITVVLNNDTGSNVKMDVFCFVAPTDSQDFPEDLVHIAEDDPFPAGSRKAFSFVVPDNHVYRINSRSGNEITLEAVIRREFSQ